MRAPPRLVLENDELMAEGENLHLEFKTRPNAGAESGEQGDEQCGHVAADTFSASCPVRPSRGVEWSRLRAASPKKLARVTLPRSFGRRPESGAPSFAHPRMA